ncbi:MAG: carboxypeptidase-like regulatory domain-containing protein [Bryobacteraceae bacterium]
MDIPFRYASISQHGDTEIDGKFADITQRKLRQTGRIMKSVRPHSSMLSLFRGALLGVLSATAAGQSPQQYNLRVNGTPVVTMRPATRVVGEWFVPLLPLARALGISLTYDPAAQSLRALRSDGITATYDGPTGRILQGSVLAGQVANFHQVQLNVGVENVVFPLNGAIALFGVTAREDPEQQVLEIESPASTGGAGANGPSFQFASLEERYGLISNGTISQQFLNVRGQTLMDGNRLNANLELTRSMGGALIGFQQGSLRLEMAHERAITAGDQGTYTGVEALMNSVRGLGYEWRWHGFLGDVYGGRAASSISSGLGTSGLARYDSTLAGFGLHRKVKTADLSLAGNGFRGARRSGTSVGAAYTGTYARNEFRLQGLLGYFSGFSLRPVLQSVSGAVGSQEAATTASGGIVEVEQETQHVKGLAYGFSAVDGFTPFKSNILMFTGLWENYSRNFLIVRGESRFSAVSRKSLAASIRPNRYISFMGSIRQETELLGSAESQSGYTFGVNASAPGPMPIQAGYFRSVQQNRGSSGTRFELSQYSLQVPRWNRFGVSAIYSEVHFGSLLSRSITETLSSDLARFGRLSFHDQLQIESGHNYGFDWSREFGRSGAYALGGLERQTSRHREAMLAPMTAVRLPLFRGQTLTMSYLNVGGSSMFRIEIGGPILRKREQVTTNSQTALVVLASLTGQVYFDADLDGNFRPAVDQPIQKLQIWLDGEVSTTTDSAGYFHFDGLAPGSHSLRARIDTLPANLIFAQEELHLAVMPYHSNRQDFRAIRTGKIQGGVTIATLDDAGRDVVKPFPDARILAAGNRDSFSESDGAFVLGDLPPGSYLLRLDPATVPGSFVCHPATQTIEVRSGKSSAAVEFRLLRPVIVRLAPALSRGVIEGFVWDGRANGRAPAPGVTVRLDHGRTSASGFDGRFRFADVTAGDHLIGIVTEQLPVEFELGPTTEATVAVTPGKAAIVELGVILVSMLRGEVIGPAGMPLDTVVIRLSGTERQTTADATGHFRFPKLVDGDYTVVLEEKMLPEHCFLTTPGSVTLSLRAGQETPQAEFRCEIRKQGKPTPVKRTQPRVEARPL